MFLKHSKQNTYAIFLALVSLVVTLKSLQNQPDRSQRRMFVSCVFQGASLRICLWVFVVDFLCLTTERSIVDRQHMKL